MATLLSEDVVAEFCAATEAGDAARTADLVARYPRLARATNRNGLTGLMVAAEMGHDAVVRVLLAAGADANAKYFFDRSTALGFAAVQPNVAVVEALIAAGASVNAPVDPYGWAPLTYATEAGHENVVKALLRAGADVNAATRLQQTPLMLAASRASAQLVHTLLEAGADVNAADQDGYTALMYAARRCNADCVHALLHAGALINHSSRSASESAGGWTALLCALNHGRPEIAKVLVAAGADVDMELRDGRTALALAAAKGLIEVLDTLLTAPSRSSTWRALEIREAHCRSAAVTALREGQGAALCALLKAGADIDAHLLVKHTASLHASAPMAIAARAWAQRRALLALRAQLV